MSEVLRAVDVIRYMDDLAPPHLALPNDKIGLQIGDVTRPVRRVWVALEATPEIVDRAVDADVDMLITHHALLYHPLQRIDYSQVRHRAIAKLIAKGMVVYSAHTNLDIARGGVNDVIAQRLALSEVEPLDVTYTTPLLKLVVYVPLAQVDILRDAIGNAGAGHIGNYSHCTFATTGRGTFLPSQGTNPFIGKPGQLEHVAEARLETVVPEPLLQGVLAAMRAVHPYEEIAYDIIPLQLPGEQYGIGRIGKLPSPMSLREFADHARTAFGLPHIRYAGDPAAVIETTAVLGGSGSGWIDTARRKGAHAMVTADASHHDVADAVQDGIAVIDVPHAAMEEPVCNVIAAKLQERLGDSVDVAAAPGSTDPWRWL
ncbi:Nif3-like dinuclear metal center hexameric protein [Alicyclobacillus acidiphilus]|uniref:Nif3-like dinuclear metal center hexameric protein n=1 Tax=Alicyclobacillus acidiphilus TaxID=182455 RepID=UPI00082B7092|nr:Nif3-like dinuclear metal center hexameric protein [Alicyclobacillus acidiphilus]